MFKKLLVAVLALTIIIGLFSPALATKNPNEAKRLLHQQLPPGPARQLSGYATHEFGPYTGHASKVVAPSNTRVPNVGPCTDYSYNGAAWYRITGGDYGAAVRFTPAGTCTLKTVSMLFDPTGTGTVGITVYVWQDGGGVPGSVAFSQLIDPTAMQFNPNFLTVDVSASNLIFNSDYFVGWVMNSSDTLVSNWQGMSDDGSAGAGRSFIKNGIAGPWVDNGTAFGLDINWVIVANACCGAAPGGGCESNVYNGAVYYRWGGKYVRAVRFSAANECSIKTVTLGFSSGGQVGTGGVDLLFFADNGGLPGTLLGTQHIPHTSMVIPGNTVVDVSANNWIAGSDYHLGVKITNWQTDDYQLRSDDGLTGTGRSSELDTTYLLPGATWTLTQVLYASYGLDPNFIITDSVCCSSLPPVCSNESYHGGAAYFWPLPDAYGDDFFNMRFSAATKCTLKTLKLGFYGPGTVGNPGATVYLWKSDGTFPTTVINSFPVNPVVDFFPAFTEVDVSALNIIRQGDFHVGYSPIINTSGDVLAILSDDGSTGTMRGSEKYGASFSLMKDDWGIDAAFFIEVYKCCQPPGYCDVAANPDDQWPTFAHDFARTSESGLKLGDLCGIQRAWIYTPAAVRNIDFTAPVIMNDRVYVAFADRYVCINLLTGVEVWNTKVAPLSSQYTAIVGSMRTMPTIEGDFIYMPTGSSRGIIKANRLTGDTIWVRASVSNPLPGTPGTISYGASVILGDAVYFGDNNGQVYALDKNTGANKYFTQLHADPPTNTLLGGTNTSGTTDGTQLFFSSSFASPEAFAIYALNPGVGGFTQNWVYTSPLAGVWGNQMLAAQSFRCDNLFLNTYAGTYYSSTSLYKGFRQNLDPLTGIEKWPDYYLMGQAWSAPPATIGGYTPLAVFANLNNGSSGSANTRAVRAVNFSNSTVWINPGTAGIYDNDVFLHVSTTQDPYVIYGTYDQSAGDGHLYFVDGNSGNMLIDYSMLGAFVEGSAIAKGSDGKPWIVTSIRNTNYTASTGKLIAFSDMGPRPRMIVPELAVVFASTNTSEAAPIQRTHSSALLNIGCAPLTFTGTMEAGAPPKARLTSVSPFAQKNATQLASRLVDYRVEDLVTRQERSSVGKMFENSFTQDENGLFVSNALSVKPADANSSRLAPPSWVSWVTPASGTGAVPGASAQDFTFQFDRTGMQLLGVNYYYVDIFSNDPDYSVLDMTQPAIQAEIYYELPYVYCDYDSGRMAFGTTGSEWYNNAGRFGDATVTFGFTLDGSSDGAFLYGGSMFFMTNMDNAAWNPFGSSVPANFGYLFGFYLSGTDCGGCQFNTTLPVEYTINGGVSYANLTGDLCSFAVIDSGQSLGFWAHQAGPSMGILVKYREVGAYGPDFGAFKLVVADIINRNATPLDGLYYGNFEDWDVGSGANNGSADMDKGIVYLNEGPVIRGQIGLPLKGSYWPDGTKTDPAYNVQINANADVVYPSAPCPECLLDSLYAYIDEHAEGAVTYTPGASASGAADDLSYEVAFGKVNLAGGATKTYGFAMYGFDNATSPMAESETLSKFINKYAGFGRGDIDNNDVIDLRDLVRLQRYLHSGGAGPVPFKHLGDVNNDGLVNDADCTYMAAFFFTGGPAPRGAFKF